MNFNVNAALVISSLIVVVWLILVVWSELTAKVMNCANLMLRFLDFRVNRVKWTVLGPGLRWLSQTTRQDWLRGLNPLDSHSPTILIVFYLLVIWVAASTQPQWIEGSGAEAFVQPLVIWTGFIAIALSLLWWSVLPLIMNRKLGLMGLQTTIVLATTVVGYTWTGHYTFLIVLGLFAVIWAANILAWGLLAQVRKTREVREADVPAELAQTDLFVGNSQVDRPVTWWQVVIGTFSVIVSRMPMVLLPAMAWLGLVSRKPEHDPYALILLALAWLLLALAHMHERLGHAVLIYRRMFFHGGPLVVSWLVIAIGILDYNGVSYVRTLVDGVPQLARGWVVTLYLAFWVYEYWLNRNLNERLLALLKGGSGRLAEITYAASPGLIDHHHTMLQDRKVAVHGGARFVALGTAGAHPRPSMPAPTAPELQGEGTADDWFAKLRCPWQPSGDERWEFYERDELMSRILGRAASEGRENELLLTVRRLARNYFGLANFVLGGLVVGFVAGAVLLPLRVPLVKVPDVIRAGVGDRVAVVAGQEEPAAEEPKTAGADADEANSDGAKSDGRECAEIDGVSLKKLLFGDGQDADKPVILLAASGGGSRAALYASSVLNGLHDIDALDNVRLLSGVSGGGYALAYYYANQEALTKAARGKKLEQAGPWRDFHIAMTHNYIAEVLQKCTETRLLTGEPMGKFLAESFDVRILEARRKAASSSAGESALSQTPRLTAGDDRATPQDTNSPPVDPALSQPPRLTAGDDRATPQDTNSPPVRQARIGDRTNIALILNTTVTGSATPLPWQSSSRRIRPNRPGRQLLVGSELRRTTNAHAYHAGARLVFTNLHSRYFDLPASPFLDWNYFVADSRDVTPGQAAALNANFPPVFPNAGVQASKSLFWVTDGGSTDNRGAISLLVALRNAIKEIKEPAPERKYPTVHVLVAEATGITIDYAHNRGVSATLYAQYAVASDLIANLHREVNDEYYRKTKAKVKLHYLEMPSVLRMRGGVGTHWMWQDLTNVYKFENNDGRIAANVAGASLDGDQMRTLFVDLHADWWQPDGASRPRRADATADERRIWEWILDDPIQKHQQHWQSLHDEFRSSR